MKTKLLIAMLLVTLIPWALIATPTDKTQGSSKAKHTAGTKGGTSVQVNVLFSKEDRGLIVSWVQGHHSSLPPGLAKKTQLPPGLQKQLVRKGTLPPGLEKQVYSLPPELERRLPPLHADYQRVAIAGSVVIMNRNTRLIADIFIP